MRIENKTLLREIRESTICERCRKQFVVIDAAHIHPRGRGRIDIRCNLVALCRLDHSYTEKRKDCEAELLAIAAKREDTTPEAIREVVAFVRDKLDRSDSEERRQRKVKHSGLSNEAKELLARELAEAREMGVI